MTKLLSNRYKILRQLGSGGFGETFLAEDTQMPSSRCCVIKQLKPITNNPQVYSLINPYKREIPKVITSPVIPTPSLSPEYYSVADSAYSDEASANQAVQRLQIAGYPEAGKFWIQDYPNLSGKALYQVYPARFRDRASCANFIQVYRQYSSDAYCVFGSNNPNVSPDRF